MVGFHVCQGLAEEGLLISVPPSPVVCFRSIRGDEMMPRIVLRELDWEDLLEVHRKDISEWLIFLGKLAHVFCRSYLDEVMVSFPLMTF